MTLRREKGTGIVKKDGEDITGQIINTLTVAGKAISTGMESMGNNLISHYKVWHSREEDYHCTSEYHVVLTQGQLIDLKDSIKVARRNIEQCEALITTSLYLSGVTIIEEDDKVIETAREGKGGVKNE